MPGSELASVGGDLGVRWWTQGSSGTFREGCDAAGSSCYTFLYVLKRIRKPVFFRRDSPLLGDDDL